MTRLNFSTLRDVSAVFSQLFAVPSRSRLTLIVVAIECTKSVLSMVSSLFESAHRGGRCIVFLIVVLIALQRTSGLTVSHSGLCDSINGETCYVYFVTQVSGTGTYS